MWTAKYLNIVQIPLFNLFLVETRDLGNLLLKTWASYTVVLVSVYYKANVVGYIEYGEKKPFRKMCAKRIVVLLLPPGPKYR